MAKTVIFLIRHGEVANRDKISYGRLPGFRLSENGRKQISNTLLRLQRYPVSQIYASPMLRARESAGIIGKYFKIKPKISYSLIEIKTIFQGVLLSEYKSKIQPFQFDEKYVKKGHESIPHIRERMLNFLYNIKKIHKGSHIVLVSHGDPIAVLKSVFDKKQFNWEYKKNNYLETGDFIKLVLE